MPKRLFDVAMVARTHRLRADQWAEIAELAEAEGLSEADVIREVMDLGLMEFRRKARRRRPGVGGSAA